MISINLLGKYIEKIEIYLQKHSNKKQIKERLTTFFYIVVKFISIFPQILHCCTQSFELWQFLLYFYM